ncbi:MAG TPA: (Fe-S)-binding protein [Candidatus Paceibacterota bacterium]|nr:(Fe-S)-binding protein [Verrucomicrobiota bacterium]HOX03883.1 (Fe-S)-binding protein [Verrucomicrobiota bacterium]HRZ46760.1 (Fe-S)-binding protein [Candidatus Paceibacterota bacterium]
MIATQETIDATAAIFDDLRCQKNTSLDNLLETPDGRRILSCIQCGTCAGTCPYGEHMDYPPRRIINMLQRGLIDEVFRSDSMLRCVSCYACMAKCPRNIRLSDVLLPLVKEQTLIHLTEMPAELQKSLQNTLRYGNPMGESSRKRAAWTATAGVPVPTIGEKGGVADILWFVECYTSYYARGQDNSRATARLFHALGLDFAILGNEEKCAGDCGQLTWESGLFETLTDYNMVVFGKYKFKRLVTGDPHAFNAFRIRYPLFGFDYPVDHTTPLLHGHLDRLKPMLKKKLDCTVTYHDSCCLGRRAGCYEPPRELLRAIPGVKLVEMTHNRVNAICCGGGGGGMWLDTFFKAKGMERLSERRIREAIRTGADVLAVSCPYEISRFEDALKTVGHDKPIVVRDVVELLADSLGD